MVSAFEFHSADFNAHKTALANALTYALVVDDSRVLNAEVSFVFFLSHVEFPLCLPTDPRYSVSGFLTAKLNVKDSATAPVILPCIAVDDSLYYANSNANLPEDDSPGPPSHSIVQFDAVLFCS